MLSDVTEPARDERRRSQQHFDRAKYWSLFLLHYVHLIQALAQESGTHLTSDELISAPVWSVWGRGSEVSKKKTFDDVSKDQYK